MRIAARGRRQPGRHRRRALPAPRGLRPPHGAAVRADQEHARRAEDDVRHERVLPARQRARWRARSREWPEAIASTLEIAERCNGRARARQAADPAATRRPTAAASASTCARGCRRACALRYGDPPPAEAVERMEMELGVIDRMGFNAYFLIVWDFVKFAKENGIAVGPGPRLGGRLDRRLLPGDHRRRPAALRPAVRALPEPRARVDAGHRHRLLRARPRARDALRDREVRARVGRADRHLRQDVPARGHARRGARARLRLRHRRPPGEADPRPDHGPLAVLRGLPEAGPAAAQGLRRGARRAKQIVDVAQGPRGDRAQLLDPRRRGRDRRPPADRHRAAAARRRRHRRERRARRSAPSRSSR